MEAKLYNGALKGSVEEVFQFNNWMERTTPTGNNILHVHLSQPLHLQINRKSNKLHDSVNIGFIQAVLNHEAISAGQSLLLWKQNANGDTPLHLATRFRHREAVEVLLKRAELVDQSEMLRLIRVSNKNKDTALHEAARAGDAGLVELFLRAGAADDPLQHQPNHAGETPIYLAAESGCDDSGSNLLCSTPMVWGLAHQGPCGRTPLHAAVLCRTSAIARKIMEIDKSVIRVQDDHGQTALHCAAARAWKLVQVLLDLDDESEPAVYIQDNEGRTALHVATLQYNWNGIKKLVTCRPDSVEIVDNRGQNVVHYAASLGCLDKVISLLEIGCFHKLINDKDVDGNTPLHLIVSADPLVPPHYCFYFKLKKFIINNQIDDRAFNKQNLCAGDILVSNRKFLQHNIPRVAPGQVAPFGLRQWTYRTSTIYAGTSPNVDDHYSYKEVAVIRERAQYHLVVATLIATVSFTAGFTLPGGLDQSPGKDLGMAVLTKQAAFKAFLVSDAMAFMCSAIAVICYLLLAGSCSLVYVHLLYKTGFLLTSLSLGTMMIAFLMGVCAVISTSHTLAIPLLIVSVLFFVPFFFLLQRIYDDARAFLHTCVL